MMQLLVAVFLFSGPALADLRVWNRSTLTGLESSNPVHRLADRASTRHLQDCEVIGWAELCQRNKLAAGSCFQLEPTVAAPGSSLSPCELRGPNGAPTQLRPAAGKILTLKSGELRITGQIQMISLRLLATSVAFADANVEAWYEGPSDSNSTVSSAFFSNGSITLTRSRLTVRGAAGGFGAMEDLSVFHSEVVIENVSAKHPGGGFFVWGDVYVSENSMVLIQNARSTENGGGFFTAKGLRVSNGSVLNLEDVTAGSNGGGFFARGEVEIAGNSTVNISNSRAESGKGGGLHTEKGLTVCNGSKLIIRNVKAGQHGGGFYAKGMLISSSTLSIQDATARQNGGGFMAMDEVVIDGMSHVSMSNSRSARNAGGFFTSKGLQVSNSSVVSLQNVTAESHGGGFVALEEVEIAGNSTVNISNSHTESGQGGGFSADKGLKVSTGSRLIIRNAKAELAGGFTVLGRTLISSSMLSISSSRSAGQAGGFQTRYLEVTSGSVVSLQNVTAGSSGGGFVAFEEVEIAGNSTVNISNSRAESGGGGGFHTEKGLTVSTGSKLIIRNAKAGKLGGGFTVFGRTLISSSMLSISSSRSAGQAGGFQTMGYLEVTNGSVLNLQDVTAGSNAGGFFARGEVEIAENSTVNISNSHAESSGDGGGFYAAQALKVSTGSKLIIRNAQAGRDGGGFFAESRIMISSSTLSIQDATARQNGGGFVVHALSLHRSSMSISNSTALDSASGGHVDGQLLLSSQSSLLVKDAQGLGDTSVLAASCFHLLDRSLVLFEGVIGGHGVELDNSGCSALCSNSTFHVAEDAALNASGRLSSGLLSLTACRKENVRLSGIHLRSWSSALLSTSPSSVVVDQVSVEYKPPVNNLQVLAAKDGFEIDSMTVSCPNCARGVTLHATKDRNLKALSSEHLQCPKTVTTSKGKTHRCKCSNYQIATERFRDVDLVPLESVFQTCTFCKPHFHFQNGDCLKCGIFNAWSDGKKDACHVLPRKKTELITLLIGAAVVVMLTFIALQILHAPLIIVDAKSDVADATQAESKKTFTLAVQGPIVDLHKGMSRLVHRWVRYRARGTGLIWLDYEQKKSNAVKVRNTGDRTLLLKDMSPPFDCASCQGSLHAADFLKLLSLLAACISVTAMLPAIIKVAVISGNGVGHVFVTAMFVTLPLVAGAALLHFPVAWLIQWLYRRTPISRALDAYRKQINCKEHIGPDAAHPRNQGLQVLILRGLWKHFESFILDRNMHFVVANIVRPLTQSKRVSFVSLWGGRQLDYFVSHCWGANFSHFVRSIQCHALAKEGPTSWFDAAYWICSFANNQWNIGAELGNDPMGSAFARALTGGIKGVAMVLDEEVQPLTRVWCLFEFFLSNRERLELVFVTNAGVVGDDRCSSFDIALEVGKKIESLQVATCEASSEKDKNDIFEYIISELGSLERMDEKIRKLMAEMLMRNLANVEKATGSLVDRLGQSCATVATLDKDDRL